MANWPGKGPYRNFKSTVGSRFDPTRLTADATFPSGVTTHGPRVQGSATTTPYVYVCDSLNNRIVVTDYDLNYLFSFGTFGTGDGEFSSPYGVATDGERVYVTDTGNNRAQYFDLDGNYLGQWGSYGTAGGEFSSPKGIAVNQQYVFVVDQGNNRFQVFTKDGEFVLAYCHYGLTEDPEDLNAPTNCYVDSYYLWIDDTGNGYLKWYELTMFEPWGNITRPVVQISGSGGWPSGRGNITRPSVSVSISGTGSVIRVGSGEIIRPAREISGTGTTLHIGSGEILLPVREISGTGYVCRVGSGEIIRPIPTISGTGSALHLGTGNLILPVRQISGSGYVILASPTYTGVVMNMRNKAITKYSGYDFNSFAVMPDGTVLGANENGVFALGGTDDNGTDIDAYITTGTFDLHDPLVRRLVDVWLSLRLSGAATLTVIENEEPEDDAHTEDILIEDDLIHDEPITLPKGLRGRFAAIKFANVDGAYFELSGLSVRAYTFDKTR